MLKALEKRLYDRTIIEKRGYLYNNKALFALLVPIIVEQLLNSFMGMVDTMMVSNVGSEAISAVSLVAAVNNLVIQVFAAMAAGAAIICSQYIGSGDKKSSNKAARQVVLTVFMISMSIMLIGIVFARPLLRLIFGQVEDLVMDKHYPILSLHCSLLVEPFIVPAAIRDFQCLYR